MTKKAKEKEKEKEGISLGEYFERETKIEKNDFVEESLNAMWIRYNLDEKMFKTGIKKLNSKLYILETYDDLMRFLAGIFKNDTQRAVKFKRKS